MPDTHPTVVAGSQDVPFQLTPASNRTLFQIKSWLPEHNAGARPLSIGGCELPSTVGATLPGPRHILCLSPCEWLLVLQEQWASSFDRHIAAAPPEPGAVLLDVTDGLAVVRVRGRAVRDVLAKGCGLDLHPQAFPAGRCARTRLAQLPVVIDCVDDSAGFDLYVARSHLRFLSDWLEDAAAEFMSCRITTPT
jgi:sarcosine oxidase, subunit gamma